MTKFLKAHPGERIDQPDFQHGTWDSQRQVEQEILSEIIMGNDALDYMAGRVLRGFEVALGASTVTVTLGSAVCGLEVDGVAQMAMVTAEGPTTRIQNVSTLSDALNYGVYVRFDFLEEEAANRVFWDAALATPAEVVRGVSTRIASSWSIAIELTASPPGDEWLLVAEFDKVAGVIQNKDDRRLFLFEGPSTPTGHAIRTQDWGAGNDRDNDRAQYGVRGLARFVMMVLAQIQDLIGNQGGGINYWQAVSQGVAQMLALDGSRGMTGTLLPATDYTATPVDIGQISPSNLRWNIAYVRKLEAVDSVVVGTLISALSASITQNIICGWLIPQIASGSPPTPNALYQYNVVKAWAFVECDGASGIVTANSDSFNLDLTSPVFAGAPATLKLSFDTNMADTKYAAVLSGTTGDANVYRVVVKNTTDITIVANAISSGAQVTMDDNDIRFSVIIMGAQ